MFTDFGMRAVGTVAGLVLAGGMAWAQPYVAYTVDSDKTLTLKYLGDSNESDESDAMVVSFSDIFEGNYWISKTCSDVNKVVFDESFKTDGYSIRSMDGFFERCTSLETVKGLGNLNTSDLMQVMNMFKNCYSLESVDFTGFNTSNIVSMMNMFYSCDELTELDLSSFNTKSVTDMSWMFFGCSNLKKIFVSENFTVDNVYSSDLMFDSCYKLEGATSYNSSNTGASMANYTTGYFLYKEDNSAISAGAPYMSYTLDSEGVLTFTYLGDSQESEGKVFSVANVFGSDCAYWIKNNIKDPGNIKKVVFDESFQQDGYSIKSMAEFFDECNAVESIEGLGNLNTSELTTVREMFVGCGKLKSIDLTGFNTSNVTNMRGMFFWCYALENLDLTGFDTQNVTNMNSMFYDCWSLTKVDLSKFNTSNVDDMKWMFGYCTGLTKVDLSTFNTSKVGDAENMFYGDTLLVTIYASDDFVIKDGAETRDMFYNCAKLVGKVAYDSDHIDGSMATFDGYLTKKVETEPSDPTAVKNLGADSLSGNVEYYDLQGRKMAAPSKGSMVIVRKGGVSQLAVVK